MYMHTCNYLKIYFTKKRKQKPNTYVTFCINQPKICCIPMTWFIIIMATKFQFIHSPSHMCPLFNNIVQHHYFKFIYAVYKMFIYKYMYVCMYVCIMCYFRKKIQHFLTKKIYNFFLFIVFNIFLTRLCFIIQMSENRNIF